MGCEHASGARARRAAYAALARVPVDGLRDGGERALLCLAHHLSPAPERMHTKQGTVGNARRLRGDAQGTSLAIGIPDMVRMTHERDRERDN